LDSVVCFDYSHGRASEIKGLHAKEDSAMAYLAEIIGALLPTFLISRFTLWLMRSWDGGAQRLIVAHSGALLISTLIGGMGMADGGAFAPVPAFLIYAPAQAIWFFADWLRHRSKRPEVAHANWHEPLQPPS